MVGPRSLRLGLAIDAALALVLGAGFVWAPLVVAHFAALLLVLLAFFCTWRQALARLAVALTATTIASTLAMEPLPETVVQLPFVYGVSGLVIALAEQVRRSRSTSDAALARVRHLALYDGLTDLPNRTLVHDRLEQAIAHLGRDASVALLLMDLDRFKEVNDTFGHHAGDELLRQIGPRLASVLRQGDTVARLGGDEFAVMLPGADATVALDAARRVSEAFAKPFVVLDQPLDVSTSIGIAVSPDHGADPDLVLQHADVAMYEAKRAFAGVALYAPGSDENGEERLRLVTALRVAIDEDQLWLDFQPIVDAPRGAVTGFEALLRWDRPGVGPVPPSEFIPAAERSGLMRRLSLWVVGNGLRQLRAWQDVSVRTSLSVNLSMRNLVDPQLAGAVGELLVQWRIEPERLTLEITESALMADEQRVAATIAELRALGTRVSIDDFGTGYSSIAYLSRLAVDELKIDQSFVTGLANDASCKAIVRGTIDLAHALGFSIVAEGVEDEVTHALIIAYGVDALQGYLVSRPLGADLIPGWLRSRVQRPRVVA